MTLRERLKVRGFETPAQEAVLSLLVAAGHVERALEDVCEKHGLTHVQYNVLRVLRGAGDEGLPRYAIAERLIDHAPDVTRLLDRLVRDGLAERYRSAEDKRLSLTRITARGLERLDGMDAAIRACHERSTARLTVGERRRLASLCGALVPRTSTSD